MKSYFLLFCFALCLLNTLASSAQNNSGSQSMNVDSSRLNDFFRLYSVAGGKREYLAAKKYLDSALMIVPDFPNVRYARARVALRLGLKEEALNDIGHVVQQRGIMIKAIHNDSLLNADLGSDPRFAEYKKTVASFDTPRDRSVVAYEIQDKMLLPEGITHDPVTNTIYMGSLYLRKIISIDKNGVIKDFIKSKQDDVLGVVGTLVDPKRRILYFCSGFMTQVIQDTNDIKDKRTAVYAYDITTGKLLQKYHHEKAVFLNDLDLAENGDVYVTDSESNKVFRINNAKKEMEIFLERPRLSSPNGIAFNKTGDLFIAAYLGGVLKVNMKSGVKTWITKPESISLAGNDGMEWYQNSLIINSPIEHKAIRRLHLNKEQTAIVKEEILAYDPKVIYECTTGTVINNELYFIANSGLDAYERNGSLKTEKLKNPVIRKVKLK